MGMLESSYLNTKPGVPVLLPGLEPALEQGALPSLLLQGLMPIFTLPGDKMFQSTGVQQGRHRPPVIHAYGGAKVGMAQALRSIAVEGWVPLAWPWLVPKAKSRCGLIWDCVQ